MAVRKGTPKPDISTVEALRQAILNAKSIAYSASASGTYLSTELFPRLGVQERTNVTAKKIFSERFGAVVARFLSSAAVAPIVRATGLDPVGVK